MATITIDTGNATQTTRITDAFAGHFAYQATLPGGGANPENKNAFAKRMLAEWVKDIVRTWESTQAAEAARVTAAASADAIVVT